MPISGLAMRCARCQNENPTDARFCNKPLDFFKNKPKTPNSTL
jgi:hypothetical protein